MRKSEFCNMCENKVSDQLYSNCTTDQCLCFCYMHRTIALLIHVSKLLASVTVQASLCQYSRGPVFLMLRLICPLFNMHTHGIPSPVQRQLLRLRTIEQLTDEININSHRSLHKHRQLRFGNNYQKIILIHKKLFPARYLYMQLLKPDVV